MIATTNSVTSPQKMTSAKSAKPTCSKSPRMVALDFETVYTSQYSVKSMGVWAYTHDPRFKATMVAAWSDGYTFSGPIKSMRWEMLDLADVLAHNAGFDKAVFDRLQETGEIPAHIKPRSWICTAALSRFCNGPSSLKDCAAAWLGQTLDKSVRDRMADGIQDMFDDVQAYALEDARVCWEIWQKLGKAWPDHEKRLADLTRRAGAFGVYLDQNYVANCRERLSGMVADGVARLPWVSEAGLPALSADAFKKYCAKIGVEPPATTAKNDPDLTAWSETNDKTLAVGWLKAMQEVRRANRTLKVFESMQQRVMPGGRMAYEMLYCGASTGRWSGSGGLNLQNLNRDEIAEGVDLRNAITAAPGHKLIIIDYSQIESRVLLWLAGDHATLDILRTGIDIYEAHARITMGYNDPRPLKDVSKSMRQLAKARVLGLGYGCGAQKFIVVAKIMGGLDITFKDSQRMVNEYRRANPLIVSLWDRLERAFQSRDGGTYRLPLPSGRKLRYYNVDGGLMTAESIKGHSEDWYGGKLTENFVSATARDVMADAWLKMVDAGIRVVFTCHDELVIECEAGIAEEVKQQAEAIMVAGPAWADGLPLAVEGHIKERYCK